MNNKINTEKSNVAIARIKFEQKLIFKEILQKLNYQIKPTNFKTVYEVIDQKKVSRGFIGEKSNKEFYDFFSEHLSQKFNQKINLQLKNGNLLPDKFYFDVLKQKVYIIQLKFQNKVGSIDWKIQTAPYKKYFCTNVFLKYDIGIEFMYVWNDWFNHRRYDGVKDFLDEHEVKYYVDELMLEDLDL